VRLTTAFSRLLKLPGVSVRKVVFEPRRVVVTVALRRQRLQCPLCAYSTPHRENLQAHESSWRHLDLGVWSLLVCAQLRRVRCPEHGVHVEAVPFARHGARFTSDFEDLVAWLTGEMDRSAITRLARVDWDTVGRIIERVQRDHLNVDRLGELFEISVDEVAWRKGHRYLTIIADHHSGAVVWGAEGKGKAAMDKFFAELDPVPPADPSPAVPVSSPVSAPVSEPSCPVAGVPLPLPAALTASYLPQGIMVPFGAGPTVPAGTGVNVAWVDAELDIAPELFSRASKLQAVSMDMTGGYAASVRQHAPQAEIVIDNFHVVKLATKALDETRRAHWNELRSAGQRDAAKHLKHTRWALLKNPEKLTVKQDAVLARIRAGGGKLARAWEMKEMVRAIFAHGLHVEVVEELIDRLLARLARCRIPAFVKLGRTIRKHRAGIIAARRRGLSNARAEAINNKVKLFVHRGNGFHSAAPVLALVNLHCGPIHLTLPHEHEFAQSDLQLCR
jgi:transposase